ncbi:hypothetical protein CL1_0949 [Thermococcus cleftensis]|uniref:Acid-resistance membrane protein n=1 Tax=Thermococcus cleftensis (strain DSM 27260 / KACC 17922 / CL1) TaxID=163003 RepID=I3ZTW8_THECF|nr:DUF308 domain-containing protein [Thermococcus cleftensis]AFL95152.1 hypothetical protein CL1_0949 [Thermococcus cleftensis]
MDDIKEPSGERSMTPEEYNEYREEMTRKKLASLMAHWQWYLLLGVVLLILGIVGLGILPFVTLASIAVFGVFLIIGGGILIAVAIFTKGESGGTRIFQLLLATLYIIAGAAMLEEPLLSAQILTFILGGAYFVFGIIKVLMGFKVQNGGLVIFSGVIDFFIGVMILANWPEWSPWVIGIFVAIELIVAGVSFIAMSLGARSMKNNPEFQV